MCEFNPRADGGELNRKPTAPSAHPLRFPRPFADDALTAVPTATSPSAASPPGSRRNARRSSATRFSGA
eukprot:709984-Pyramimonas_sp.AAC.1